jgi:hypothetical protein
MPALVAMRVRRASLPRLDPCPAPRQDASPGPRRHAAEAIRRLRYAMDGARLSTENQGKSSVGIYLAPNKGVASAGKSSQSACSVPWTALLFARTNCSTRSPSPE